MARNGVRWLAGAPVVAVQHLLALRHVDRVTVDVATLSEPPPRPQGGPASQGIPEGHGPLVMRTYSIDLIGASLDGPALIRRLLEDPNRFCPNGIASFMRDDESAHDLSVGDEVAVELPGPWDGPVRVERADDVLLLHTLDGHMEAGHIRFDTVPVEGGYTFRIRSWARAGDRAFLLLHVVAKVAWEMQTAMWVQLCTRACEISGGQRVGPIRVHSEVLQPDRPRTGADA